MRHHRDFYFYMNRVYQTQRQRYAQMLIYQVHNLINRPSNPPTTMHVVRIRATG